jgi:hypothetical protein
MPEPILRTKFQSFSYLISFEPFDVLAQPWIRVKAGEGLSLRNLHNCWVYSVKMDDIIAIRMI